MASISDGMKSVVAGEGKGGTKVCTFEMLQRFVQFLPEMLANICNGIRMENGAKAQRLNMTWKIALSLPENGRGQAFMQIYAKQNWICF